MVGVELSSSRSTTPSSPASSPRSEKSKENDVNSGYCDSDIRTPQKLSSQWRKRCTSDDSSSESMKRRPFEEEIDQRLQALKQENHFLKSQLERSMDTVIVQGPKSVPKANGTAVPSNGTTMLSHGTAMPSNGTTIPSNGIPMSLNGTTMPSISTAMPLNGTTIPANGTNFMLSGTSSTIGANCHTGSDFEQNSNFSLKSSTVPSVPSVPLVTKSENLASDLIRPKPVPLQSDQYHFLTESGNGTTTNLNSTTNALNSPTNTLNGSTSTLNGPTSTGLSSTVNLTASTMNPTPHIQSTTTGPTSTQNAESGTSSILSALNGTNPTNSTSCIQSTNDFQQPNLCNLYNTLNTTPAFQHLASLLYPTAFDSASVYNNLFNGMSLNSLANLQAILQQQTQQQQAFSTFASATALTAPLEASQTSSQSLSDLVKEPINLLVQNPLFSAQNPAVSNTMRFDGLFPSSSKTEATDKPTDQPSGSLDNKSGDNKEIQNAEANFPVGASHILQRGPGNIQFLNHLPTAHEPRSSVLHHTDSIQSSSNWPLPTQPKVEPRPFNYESYQNLASILSNPSRLSPTVIESRTEKQSGLVERRSAKSSSPQLILSTSQKSDSDSLGSPHSTRSTTDSNRSQISPALHDGTSQGTSSKTNAKYQDRRRRNNEAAKRCRANRRAIFEMRSHRAQQLELENNNLRNEMVKLNSELEQLKAVIEANHRRLHV
ncbi:unnamed protein product [Bursaphelenchus okinawaensis]|uniref:BZIP domain-containing protein n=1 Tax=Bursaphelenchus okinawaensis TaxID=465554 RepID=A0A811K2C4_9BILA|nr:unnamed protein product [Bursaphelenchus okinawaensis]CAG9089464.1 unnamed protein product [Bursaphelenchus okinawaensis]